MNLNERISFILEHEHLSAAAFAKRIGAKTTQSIYDILSGKTKSLSQDMLNKIVSCFPGYSSAWLLAGEGSMFIGNIQRNENGDNFQGDGITINKTNEGFISLLQKKDEQIDRLLTIIEKMQGI